MVVVVVVVIVCVLVVIVVVICVIVIMVVIVVVVCVIVFGEEIGIDFEFCVQVEVVQVEDFFDVCFVEIYDFDCGFWVYVYQVVFEVCDGLVVDEV